MISGTKSHSCRGHHCTANTDNTRGTIDGPGAVRHHTVGHQVANTISRKVQTLNDPGTYTGDRAKFHEWWTKMKVWIRAHKMVLTLNFYK